MSIGVRIGPPPRPHQAALLCVPAPGLRAEQRGDLRPGTPLGAPRYTPAPTDLIGARPPIDGPNQFDPIET